MGQSFWQLAVGCWLFAFDLVRLKACRASQAERGERCPCLSAASLGTAPFPARSARDRCGFIASASVRTGGLWLLSAVAESKPRDSAEAFDLDVAFAFCRSGAGMPPPASRAATVHGEHRDLRRSYEKQQQDQALAAEAAPTKWGSCVGVNFARIGRNEKGANDALNPPTCRPAHPAPTSPPPGSPSRSYAAIRGPGSPWPRAPRYPGAGRIPACCLRRARPA